MSRKKKEPDPEVIRLTNLAVPVVPSYTIVNISEADLRALHDGYVPTWIHETAAWELRDRSNQPDDKRGKAIDR